MVSKTHLEEYLLKHIPISAALGVKVEQAVAHHVILSAPFSNNINHKQTVFGGSLHAVATLACWSLLHVNLSELYGPEVQVVIASSEIKYLLPVDDDFKVECKMPLNDEWQLFLRLLQKKGKARLKLVAKIMHKRKLCVDYSGIFVAMSTKNC
jgi:thioesterase domain-containing protein